MSEAKHILDMYYKQTSSQKPIKASYLVCRALENTEFQNVMVVTEENLKKLDGNIIYYYIYSILPDDCTVPIVTVNYSNPIPDDNTAVVPIKEKQLLMTDFINVVKGIEKTPRRKVELNQRWKQASIVNFTLPIKKNIIVNDWERKLSNEFAQLEENLEWMRDEEGDRLCYCVQEDWNDNNSSHLNNTIGDQAMVDVDVELFNDEKLKGDPLARMQVFDQEKEKVFDQEKEEVFDQEKEEVFDQEKEEVFDQETQNSLNWMEDEEGDRLCNLELDQHHMFDSHCKVANEEVVDQETVNSLSWMEDEEGDVFCYENQEGFEAKLESKIVDNNSEAGKLKVC